MGRSPIAALAIAAAWCGTLQAQTVSHGSLVRVTAPRQGLHGVRATVHAAKRDTIVLDHVQRPSRSGFWRTDTAAVAVPIADIQSMDVQTLQGPFLQSALTGAVVTGAAAFLIVKAGEKSSCWMSVMCWEPGHAGEATAIGAAVGFGLGAIVGLTKLRHEWRRVPLEPLRARAVAVVPQPDGRLALAVSLEF